MARNIKTKRHQNTKTVAMFCQVTALLTVKHRNKILFCQTPALRRMKHQNISLGGFGFVGYRLLIQKTKEKPIEYCDPIGLKVRWISIVCQNMILQMQQFVNV